MITGYLGNPSGRRAWIESALEQGQRAGRWPDNVLDLSGPRVAYPNPNPNPNPNPDPDPNPDPNPNPNPNPYPNPNPDPNPNPNPDPNPNPNPHQVFCVSLGEGYGVLSFNGIVIEGGIAAVVKALLEWTKVL